MTEPPDITDITDMTLRKRVTGSQPKSRGERGQPTVKARRHRSSKYEYKGRVWLEADTQGYERTGTRTTHLLADLNLSFTRSSLDNATCRAPPHSIVSSKRGSSSCSNDHSSHRLGVKIWDSFSVPCRVYHITHASFHRNPVAEMQCGGESLEATFRTSTSL